MTIRKGSSISFGAAPALMLVASMGLVCVALGDNAARDGATGATPLFWLGLALIVLPVTFRLFGGPARRPERLMLVVVLGVALYLVKVLHSPEGFTRFDEFGFLRATYDLARTGNPFLSNPITEATVGYPALAMITQALSSLTGLSVFHAGLIVIGFARATFVLALYLFLERILGSYQPAGIGVVLYTCNSSFLYFDAQFAYESLGLMFAVVVLSALVRWLTTDTRTPRRETLGFAALSLIVAGGLVITHHLSSLFVLGTLLVWAAMRGIGSRRGWDLNLYAPGLLPIALAIAVMTGLWLGLVAGHVTISELGDLLSNAVHSAIDLVTGEKHPKQPFSGTGVTTTLPERAAILMSVLLVTAVILAGLLALAKERTQRPAWLTLAAVALLWPFALAMRLTDASTEISARAPQYVFLGVAFLGAYLTMRFVLPRWQGRRLFGVRLVATALVAVLFAGGVIFGELKATRQPGPYLVGAEDRSVTPEGVAAARFASAELPARSHLLADRTNAALLGSYGDLDPTFGSFKGTPLSEVLTGPRLDRNIREALVGLSIQFVLVDSRLSTSLPLLGYYVDSSEPQPRRVSQEALAKFDSDPSVSKIYTNGPIAIYDTSALSPRSRNPEQRPSRGVTPTVHF